MKIKEILILEKANNNQIILIKEGIFWRAYNLSAYLFTTFIQEFKITKKHFNVVNKDMVFLGFPNTILDKILKGANQYFGIINKEDTIIRLALKKEHLVDIDGFQIWFNSFESTNTKKANNNCKKVFQKIKNFPILTRTPIESQLFLVSLQKEVNGII